jgi:hypothetical protein
MSNMLAQLDAGDSSDFFEVIYGAGPPDNIRQLEPGYDTNNIADNVALQIQ